MVVVVIDTDCAMFNLVKRLYKLGGAVSVRTVDHAFMQISNSDVSGILIRVRSGGVNWVQHIAALREASYNAPILFYDGRYNEIDHHRLLRAGADGYATARDIDFIRYFLSICRTGSSACREFDDAAVTDAQGR